jgi:hypothetical protein
MGKGTPPTTTTTAELSPEQKQLFQLGLPGVESFAATVPQRYPGQTVAGFDPSQTTGQEMALGAAGAQNALASGAANTEQYLLGDLNAASNPMLRSAIEASTRPIYQGLTESALPALRGEADTTGQFGSSRQAIAEGLASGRASQAAGDTASRLAQSVYETNLSTQLKALGLLPTVQQGQVQGALTTSGVGDVRQAQAQRELDAAVSGYNYDQLAPFLQSKELLGLAAGLPGGTAKATGSVPQTNPWTTGLSGDGPWCARWRVVGVFVESLRRSGECDGRHLVYVGSGVGAVFSESECGREGDAASWGCVGAAGCAAATGCDSECGTARESCEKCGWDDDAGIAESGIDGSRDGCAESASAAESGGYGRCVGGAGSAASAEGNAGENDFVCSGSAGNGVAAATAAGSAK